MTKWLVAIAALIVLILLAIYFSIKSELKKICFTPSIEGLDISQLQLLQGSNKTTATINIVIFNKSKINIDVEEASFKIYYKGVLIGENVAPIKVSVQSNEIKEIEFDADIYVTQSLIGVFSSFLSGSEFPIEYSFRADIYGIPFNTKGSAMIGGTSTPNPNCE